MAGHNVAPADRVLSAIHVIRGQRVMLASVLNTPIAVAASLQVVRAFIHLRGLLATHQDLARRLEELEKKYDARFAVVFRAIKDLMTPLPAPPRKRIGFIASRRS